MTAITVVAIAAIGGVFTVLVYPRIKANIVAQTKCVNKYNCTACEGGQQTCQVVGEDGSIETGLVCPCEEQ